MVYMGLNQEKPGFYNSTSIVLSFYKPSKVEMEALISGIFNNAYRSIDLCLRIKQQTHTAQLSPSGACRK